VFEENVSQAMALGGIEHIGQKARVAQLLLDSATDLKDVKLGQQSF
jgi:hypothetical protein